MCSSLGPSGRGRGSGSATHRTGPHAERTTAAGSKVVAFRASGLRHMEFARSTLDRSHRIANCVSNDTALTVGPQHRSPQLYSSVWTASGAGGLPGRLPSPSA